MKFPKDFLFGSATAAHQIEGGNTNSDWYEFELVPGHVANGGTSLKACDSWNKFKEDTQLLVNSHQNAYRFSIEWAKIEPEEGKWSEEAINHYLDLLADLRKNHITPMITLFHFTLPKWFAAKGGFTKSQNIKYFLRYCQKMISEYNSPEILWTSHNEPNVYVLKGFIEGSWCPGIKNKLQAYKVSKNLIKSHNIVYRAIKKQFPEVRFGIVMNMAAYRPLKHSTLNKLIVYFSKWVAHGSFTKSVIKQCDFLGINYYMQFTLQTKKPIQAPDDSPTNDYDWHLHPEGIYQVIVENKKWGIPIYICENGVADANDSIRPKFLEDTFHYLEKAIRDGAPLQGYFHWSLLDNFEWSAGYSMKFGLHTRDRKPRPSVEIYKNIIDKYSTKEN